jgi:hypothetical protein
MHNAVQTFVSSARAISLSATTVVNFNASAFNSKYRFRAASFLKRHCRRIITKRNTKDMSAETKIEKAVNK